MNLPRAHRPANNGGEAGFTLVELLVAMTVTAVLLGAVSSAFIFLLRQPPQTVENLTSSDSAFRTNSTFSDDIESASPVAGKLAVARNEVGCGNDQHSLVRVLTSVSSGVEVRSYSVSGSGRKLERRVCRGLDQTAALAATPAVRTVVPNLASGSSPAVACRATAAAALAPSTPAGDLQCRLVTMTTTTSSNLTFTVAGRRDTIQSPLTSPAPTKQSCTLVSGSDSYVDNFPGHANSIDGANTSFQVQFKRGGVRLNGYLKVDLLSGCVGNGEPAIMPGGKQLKSATLTLTLLDRDNGGYQDGGFRLTTLPSWATWNEDTLNYSKVGVCGLGPPDNPKALSIPCQSRPDGTPAADQDPFFDFNVGSAWNNGQKIDIPVLGTVQRWYDGPAVNQGWTLDRGERFGTSRGPDGDQDGGWHFGSHENPVKADRPTLTVTWK